MESVDWHVFWEDEKIYILRAKDSGIKAWLSFPSCCVTSLPSSFPSLVLISKSKQRRIKGNPKDCGVKSYSKFPA